MNCKSAQQQLLGLEDPSRPSTRLVEHLRQCSNCRAMLVRLQRLEDEVRALPTPSPAAEAKAVCIERFLLQPMVSTLARRSGSAVAVKQRWRWTAALAASLALVTLLGWSLFAPRTKQELVRQSPPADTFLASVVERQIQLSRSTNPSERIEALTGLANELSNQAQQLARVASGEDLGMLAKLYERVVRSGLIKQASQVPLLQREQLLKPIADELARCATRLEQLATEVPLGAEEPLRDIVSTAREGDRRLRQILTEERS